MVVCQKIVERQATAKLRKENAERKALEGTRVEVAKGKKFAFKLWWLFTFTQEFTEAWTEKRHW